MSESDVERQGVSQEDKANEPSSADEKQVPVSEAIRYRRRAQAAERNVEELSERLEQAETARAALAHRVEALEEEGSLVRRLAEAGAVDLEAALLLVRERRSASPDEDAEAVVTRLRREKAYLFSSAAMPPSAAMVPTAGAKAPVDGRRMTVEQAARRAKETGDARDLCAYLRVRRQFG
jgi:hypothetical protein